MTNIERFDEFVRLTDENKQWSDYVSLDGKRLIKQRVIESCKLPRSSLYQNCGVELALAQLERRLRREGILISDLEKFPVPEHDDAKFAKVVAQLESRLEKFEGGAAALTKRIEDVRAELSYIIRSR